MNLKGKIAVVTGASSGLGAATATALIDKGASVYGLARNENRLRQLSQQLGDNFHPVPMDVRKTEKIQSWIKKTFDTDRQPHILINNAGISKFDNVDALSTADWNNMVDVNLSAVHHMTAAITPFMKMDNESSHIINIGSILGKVSGSRKSAYSATKFAIQGYSEALFKELRGFNIKVTCFNPGSINTDFFHTSGIIPNDHMLKPNELADILIFLLETPDNVLIDELTVRPLMPKR